ncbi:unnamed protein product [Ixodes hexagonus]
MRVNGNLLSNYQRQTVCLLGRVLQSDINGMSLKLESPDKQVVQVIMKKPIQEPLEGLLEVVGELTAKLAVVCHSYVLFPPSENFDMETYNQVVELINKHKEYYPTMASC